LSALTKNTRRCGRHKAAPDDSHSPTASRLSPKGRQRHPYALSEVEQDALFETFDL
jgi:hypothetical protein